MHLRLNYHDLVGVILTCLWDNWLGFITQPSTEDIYSWKIWGCFISWTLNSGTHATLCLIGSTSVILSICRDVNKARDVKAKARDMQGQGHRPKAKATDPRPRPQTQGQGQRHARPRPQTQGQGHRPKAKTEAENAKVIFSGKFQN